MYIDSKLRELLWSNEGFVYSHVPKTAGTSVKAALKDLPGYIDLRKVTTSNLEVSPKFRVQFESNHEVLRQSISAGRPWILNVSHQPFGNGWHHDLPPKATVLLTYRSTAARLQSWIRYFSKLTDWAEQASFEVQRDGTLRHFSATSTFPGYTGASEWKSPHEWVGDAGDQEKFVSLIRTKLMGTRIREKLKSDPESVLTEMISGSNFYYRDLFPSVFIDSRMFRHRTTVIPFNRLEAYITRQFGVSMPHFNTSTDIDIQQVTNLDAEQFAEITNRLAKPIRHTEDILLARAWPG